MHCNIVVSPLDLKTYQAFESKPFLIVNEIFVQELNIKFD